MAVPSVVLTASAGFSGTTGALTITGTVNVNDVIYVMVSVQNGTSFLTSTVTCTGSTNAQLRQTFNSNTPIQSAWATISSSTVNPVFTVNLVTSSSFTVGALVIRGTATPTNPFDACPCYAIERQDGNAQLGNSQSFSTYNNDSLLIFGQFNNNSTAVTAPLGWTEQINTAPNARLVIATLDAPTPVDSVYAQMSLGPNPFSIGDAITGTTFTAPVGIPWVVATGTASGHNVNTLVITINGTVLPNDVIYVMTSFGNGSGNLTSVSCVGSSNAAIRHPNVNQALEIAWATISTMTVNPTFTLNLSGLINVSSVALVIRGAATPTSPFDGGAAIPTLASSDTASFTTTLANDLLIFSGFLNNGTIDVEAPTGWKTMNWKALDSFCIVATLPAPSPVTGLSAQMIGSVAGHNPFTFADAISATLAVAAQVDAVVREDLLSDTGKFAVDATLREVILSNTGKIGVDSVVREVLFTETLALEVESTLMEVLMVNPAATLQVSSTFAEVLRSTNLWTATASTQRRSYRIR